MHTTIPPTARGMRADSPVRQGMGLTYSSVVDAPRDEVFAWHARPGAFNRLSPPWSPTAGGHRGRLAQGRARRTRAARRAALGGRTPSGFLRSRRGVSSTPSAATGWPRCRRDSRCGGATPTISKTLGDNRTRVIDRVDTPVPGVGVAPDVRLPAPPVGRRPGRAPAGRRARSGAADRRRHRIVGAGRFGADRISEHRRPSRHPAGPRNRTGRRRTEWNPDDPDPELLAGVDAVDPSGRRLDRRPVHRRATETRSATAGLGRPADWPNSSRAPTPGPPC